MSIFSFNKENSITIEVIDNSTVYYIDNFYENPDQVLNLFLTNKPDFHKRNDTCTYNGIYFEDKRHRIKNEEIVEIYEYLGKFIKQVPCDHSNIAITNCTRFKDVEFNDYESNYWWPHVDSGYNAILYLNKGDSSNGTNLYQNLNPTKEPPRCPEHHAPWRNKINYKLIKSLKPRYNRMILFDGLKFYHGMNIADRRYFHDEYRMNQVFFFQ